MRFEISDEAASTFAGRVYSAIAQGFPIDAAMAAVASDAQAVVHAEPQPDAHHRHRRSDPVFAPTLDRPRSR